MKLVKYILISSLMFVLFYGVCNANENIKIVGWAGLWNHEMLDWAENENRLNTLCPTSMAADKRESCRSHYLSPKKWKIPAYEKPDSKSDKIGEIIITVTPGKPFEASFSTPTNNKEILFEPDLFDQDWGYGPHLHQTILAVKGDWIKLPSNPSKVPVWVNVMNALGQNDIIVVRETVVYKFNSKDIVIVKHDGNNIYYRPEQPADMWCEWGEPPQVNNVDPVKIGIKELYDSNKHLKLDIKYKRGC